ncbi:MAG: universal stress protein [Sphingomonadaceae bacterium]|jgi:nucleotide-binding universal stress UspA family protein
MTIKSIFLLAPAETAVVGSGPVAFAISMAKAYGASLTAFSVALDVTTPGRNTDAAGVIAALQNAADAAGVSCSLITEHSHALGVNQVVAEHARLHDISIVGSQDIGLLNERMLAECLMFESGRPVIVVPQTHATPYTLGALAVAWDNTPAAGRALGDAIALLAPEHVHFLTIVGEKEFPTDLDSAALVTATGKRGIKADYVKAALFGRSIASALQEEAAATGSEILVMGAYGHSRLRRFMMGSATADILQSSTMPTLLSH